jgi:hypothetical protein
MRASSAALSPLQGLPRASPLLGLPARGPAAPAPPLPAAGRHSLSFPISPLRPARRALPVRPLSLGASRTAPASLAHVAPAPTASTSSSPPNVRSASPVPTPLPLAVRAPTQTPPKAPALFTRQPPPVLPPEPGPLSALTSAASAPERHSRLVRCRRRTKAEDKALWTLARLRQHVPLAQRARQRLPPLEALPHLPLVASYRTTKRPQARALPLSGLEMRLSNRNSSSSCLQWRSTSQPQEAPPQAGNHSSRGVPLAPAPAAASPLAAATSKKKGRSGAP